MARSPLGGTASNATPGAGGAGGTMGGVRFPRGRRPGGRSPQLGDEVYLWLLVILEVAAMGFLRNKFRRRHGG